MYPADVVSFVVRSQTSAAPAVKTPTSRVKASVKSPVRLVSSVTVQDPVAPGERSSPETTAPSPCSTPETDVAELSEGASMSTK